MKKSIFNGHLINNAESKKLYEEETDFNSSNPFNEKVEIISRLGISDWEQLYSLLKRGGVKTELNEVLKLSSISELSTLQAICVKALPEQKLQQLQQTEMTEHPFGARKPYVVEKIDQKYKSNTYTDFSQLLEVNKKLTEVNAFSKIPEFTLANSINHIRQLGTIRDQGKRGTCTAFAVTAANEFSFFKKTERRFDFSEQHLTYESKVLEDDLVCGIWIRSAMQVISNKGQCTEGIWSYNPNTPCVQQYGKPSNADANSSGFRNTFFFIQPNDVNALKQALSSGRIIPFSIPVFDNTFSYDSELTGRIMMPLSTNIEPEEGHSMVLVGYQDDNFTAGGGYFIVRNSWGESWARDSYYGAGYGTIPYAYIRNYCWEAYSF